MPNEQPFPNQISLVGDEANVYEAIATLEYLGRPVGTPDLIAATGLAEAIVRECLKSLTDRDVLIEREENGQAAYEPAYRGWSAAPEQATGWRQ